MANSHGKKVWGKNVDGFETMAPHIPHLPQQKAMRNIHAPYIKPPLTKHHQ